MDKASDDRGALLERIAALEHRVDTLERRLGAPAINCPNCGGVLEVLALRTNHELHDREEAWGRCAVCGYAAWRPRASAVVGGS